jgi:hypothetical protein
LFIFLVLFYSEQFPKAVPELGVPFLRYFLESSGTAFGNCSL